MLKAPFDLSEKLFIEGDFIFRVRFNSRGREGHIEDSLLSTVWEGGTGRASYLNEVWDTLRSVRLVEKTHVSKCILLHAPAVDKSGVTPLSPSLPCEAP